MLLALATGLVKSIILSRGQLPVAATVRQDMLIVGSATSIVLSVERVPVIHKCPLFKGVRKPRHLHCILLFSCSAAIAESVPLNYCVEFRSNTIVARDITKSCPDHNMPTSKGKGAVRGRKYDKKLNCDFNPALPE